MRYFWLFLIAGCGPQPGNLKLSLPNQFTTGAEGIQLSIFDDQECASLSLPLDGTIPPILQQEFSRGALSETTGISATLSLNPVPAETPLTLTAEVFGPSKTLQFKGCQDQIVVNSDQTSSINLILR
ncbi:MAG: hypothetical protein CMH58_03600 [Myxococcales bacterium]|nr:hypothetical protein [Myxococcales bacterium]